MKNFPVGPIVVLETQNNLNNTDNLKFMTFCLSSFCV